MENSNVRPGYTFAGWYIDKECTKRVNPGGRLPHTVTLYDKWIPILYPVSYDLHGGNNDGRNPRNVTIESGVMKLYPATHDHLQFVGWMLDGKMVSLLPEGLSRPVTLHAMFRRPIKAFLETNGGAPILPRIATLENRITPFADPVRMGFAFAGWYKDKELSQPFDWDEEVNHDIHLYAKWKEEKYPVTYHLDGGMASRTNPKWYTYQEQVIPLLPARKKGHHFVGWFDAQGNQVDYIPPRSLGPRELWARYKPVNEGMSRVAQKEKTEVFYD